MTDQQSRSVAAMRWFTDRLELLDQRQLPARETYLVCNTAEDVAAAIGAMAVRGAPAIGIAAAYGYALAARACAGQADSLARLDAVAEMLARSRPTAINLRWALQRLNARARASGADPEVIAREAEAIHREDLEQNRRMGEAGARLLPESAVVMTHCNTGALATGGHGTALGVIRSARQLGRLEKVFVTETRPWLQGARLTTWELSREGIPATLIVDAAAGHVFATEKVDWLIVGADRITAAGDVANKIGTYGLVTLANAHHVKVMVVAPSSSFDLDTRRGHEIPLETRPAAEIWNATGHQEPPPGLSINNPVFDITPAEKITAIVSEMGIFSPPREAEIRAASGTEKS